MDAPRVSPADELVPCGRFNATLRVRICMIRATAVWPSGKRRDRPKFPACAGCPAARLRLRRSPWFTPPEPSQAAEVLSRAQQRARYVWRRSFPSYAVDDVGLDPFAEAALATPDDGGGLSVDCG